MFSMDLESENKQLLLLHMKSATSLHSSVDCICGSNLHKLAWPR